MTRMTRILAIGFVSVSALAGCEALTPVAEDVAREQAKGVVNGVVATQLPGVNVEPVTDCIIDNATLDEVFTIAAGAATGTNQAIVDTVLGIAQRPATQTCILNAGLTTLLL